MKINVNGRVKDIGENMTHIDYDGVVALAYSGETPPRALHSVAYQDGVNNSEGILHMTSQPVPVKEGMIFNCHITNNS